MKLFDNVKIGPGIALVQAVLEVVDESISVQLAQQPQLPRATFSPNYPGLATIGKELVVWVDQGGIRWDASNRVLSCDDESSGQPITVQFHVLDEISVVCLSRDRKSKDKPYGVFVEKVQRFATPEEGGWYYPSLPVVTRALKYVDVARGVASEPRSSEGRISWQIPFRGGVMALLEEQEGSSSLCSVGKSTDTSEIAVWPPRTLGDPWKFYSIYLGKSLKDRPVQFWTQDVTSHQLRPVLATSGDKFLRFGNVCTLVLCRPSKGLFLVVSDGVSSDKSEFSSGLFPLISGLQPIGTNVPTIMLDFGTSNTAGAISIGAGENLDFGKSPTSSPRIVVGTENPKRDRAYLQTDFPWIPTVPSRISFGNRVAATMFTEIPTALFKLRDDWLNNGAPFQDFGLGNASVDMKRAEGIEWKTGIKWMNDAESHTELFLTTLLIWVAGLYADEISSIRLAATYPLAFDTNRRGAFGNAITGACRRVGEWTGFSATPFKRDPLVVDEGTALQFLGEKAFDRCSVDEEETSKLVLTADIGGGTFDLSLSVLQNRNFRILAADSVKFGAELIINALQEQTSHPDANADSNELRYLITRTVREGLLDRVMAASQADGSSHGNPWSDVVDSVLAKYRNFPSWVSTARDSADGVQVRGHLFFYMLAEYASRFVAGTLLDEDALKHRILNAPGTANIHADSPEFTRLLAHGPVAIAVILGGNGWNFLSRDVASMGFRNWQTLVETRTAELLQSRSFRWTANVEWAWPENLPKGKGATSIGAVRALRPENGLGEGEFCDVEAAPNGINDLKRPSSSGEANDRAVAMPAEDNWWVQVGPGSHFADGARVLPPYSRHAAQRGDIEGPSFSNQSPVLLPVARKHLNNQFRVLTAEGAVKDIRERQIALSRNAGYRVIPTIRVLWEEHLHKLVSKNPVG